VARGLADLLAQLALGGLQRRLALDVELAGRQLEREAQDRLARLAHEPDALVVVGDDRRRVLAADDLALDLLAVVMAKALDGDGEGLAVEDGLTAERLNLLAHRLPAICPSAVPAASAAAKNSGSSRPIERVGRPLAA
jgi:hypothetical protein